jgi:hypothetical protein
MLGSSKSQFFQLFMKLGIGSAAQGFSVRKRFYVTTFVVLLEAELYSLVDLANPLSMRWAGFSIQHFALNLVRSFLV